LNSLVKVSIAENALDAAADAALVAPGRKLKEQRHNFRSVSPIATALYLDFKE